MLGKLALFGQLKSMGGRRLESLTATEIGEIAKGFGLDVQITDELKAAGMALLAGKDLNTVSDMIQNPESVIQLVTLLKNGAGSPEPTIAEQQVGAMALNLF